MSEYMGVLGKGEVRCDCIAGGVSKGSHPRLQPTESELLKMTVGNKQTNNQTNKMIKGVQQGQIIRFGYSFRKVTLILLWETNRSELTMRRLPRGGRKSRSQPRKLGG